MPIPFPGLIRVLRLITVLVRHFDTVLSTECEVGAPSLVRVRHVPLSTSLSLNAIQALFAASRRCICYPYTLVP